MRTQGAFFVDDYGRTRILRGVNLGGSSKVPANPNGATWRAEHFYHWRGVSFVGRPFPLAEAHSHFRRLRACGFNFLRFLVTWEAIEHDGPGEYDEAYLDYVREVLKIAQDYGIMCFIDPHQDVWSRWTGGDGAPAWTLELAGFDLQALYPSGAALTHQAHGDPFPQMAWPSNYTKLAAATMFTLFFGGDVFAPATRIQGESAQGFLQRHFIGAISQLAQRVADLPNVIGFDSMNEPSGGFIGQPADTLGVRMMSSGPTPTPYQAMLAGAGYAVDVEEWGMSLYESSVRGTTTLNPGRVRAWRAGYDCVWKQNGVWTDADGTPQLLRPRHFQNADGSPTDVANDYIKPFILRFCAAVREHMPHAILFVEGVPGGAHPHWSPQDPPNAVNAAHWYDVMTLYYKRFFRDKTLDWFRKEMVHGAENVQSTFNRQVAAQAAHAAAHMNGIPTLIGEFGLPFDLDNKRAYTTGDFSEHEEALGMYYDAMDANLMSCTLWNYTPDNTNEHGDGWNDEDLSIFSPDQQTHPANLMSGLRAPEGYVRPYAMAVQGQPAQMRYDRAARTLTLAYRADTRIAAPTLIFAPTLVYPQGVVVTALEGSITSQHSPENSLIEVWAQTSGEVRLRVAPR